MITLGESQLRRGSSRFYLVLSLFLLLGHTPEAKGHGGFGGSVCDPARQRCWDYAGGSQTNSAPAYPSTSSKIQVNPSAVPVDDGFGIETLYYDGSFDFDLVKGTGRIGASISTVGGENNYFGNLAPELSLDFLAREQSGEKYHSQNIALATAFSLYSNKQTDLTRFNLNVGVSGKYNRITQHAFPGGGVSGIVGPFTFGYAINQEEVQLDGTQYGLPITVYGFETETLSAGLYLTSFAFDYSKSVSYIPSFDNWTVQLYTASLLLKHWIITASQRVEDSDRPVYDPSSQSLITQEMKTNYFGGIQYSLTKTILLGAFYDYYLLNDFSVGLTLFL